MEDDNVQLGIWTNYSNGTVLGPTFTTTRARGDLLIAFTGFLIPLIASRFWKICCVIFHRMYSTSHPRDAIHHQRQIIFRNSPSPDSGLIALIRLLWAWRRAGRDSYARLLPNILFVSSLIVAFTVAGGLSSMIASAAGDQVLLRGDNCGIISSVPQRSMEGGGSPDTETIYTVPRTYAAGIIDDAANYAQQCYNGKTTGGPGCEKYVVDRLPTAVSNTSSGCPFGGDLCKSNSSNMLLDTGYIDSNRHLGLNVPQHTSFSWRYVLQCAPLKTDGYTKSGPLDNKTFVAYQYGNLVTGPPGNHSSLKYTYLVEDTVAQNQSMAYGTSSGLDYRLSIATSIIYNGTVMEDYSAFYANPELIEAGGDINIIFLSGNGILFSEPSNDTWYHATTPGAVYTSSGFGSLQGYRLNEAASPMGCVEQYQWCNNAYPKESGCGPLGSLFDSIYGAAPLFNLTAKDLDNNARGSINETGERLFWPALMLGNGLYITQASVVFQLGTKSLASRKSLYGGVQYTLAENQWQLDVTNWWDIMLASVQAIFVDVAVGPNPTDNDLELFKKYPDNKYEQKLCNSQKIRSKSYASFNLFALLFIYVTAALVIIVSLVLEPGLRWLQEKRGRNGYASLEWSTNGTLQLHRLVQEELGLTEWSGCAYTVPTTSPEHIMASLDTRDPDHPVFSRHAMTGLGHYEPKEAD
ncbi:hypothetical protein F5Y19DRAFT_474166 [Xylariaceae sp. FL1651]|nr:hypothetical protein F5Y19DRAFT_474166 [Xylariaceae sp. FL1651]